MTRISQKFPFMRESSVPPKGAERLGAPASASELPQLGKELVWQQLGHTAAYLHHEYGTQAFVTRTTFTNMRSNLSFYSDQEKAVVSILAEHQAAGRLGELSIVFADLSDNDHGAQKMHEYGQVAGRGPVRRVDTGREDFAQPLGHDEILDRAIVVVPGEARDMHQFLVEKTDAGIYVPISPLDALALQRGAPPTA